MGVAGGRTVITLNQMKINPIFVGVGVSMIEIKQIGEEV